jgi:hypothetical protein
LRATVASMSREDGCRLRRRLRRWFDPREGLESIGQIAQCSTHTAKDGRQTPAGVVEGTSVTLETLETPETLETLETLEMATSLVSLVSLVLQRAWIHGALTYVLATPPPLLKNAKSPTRQSKLFQLAWHLRGTEYACQLVLCPK